MTIIEIEGIDGVGKTTQCELLRKGLEQQGKQTIVVKDLESTALGRGIRKVLVGSESRPAEVELFSFIACKAQLFSQVVEPAISAGTIVICDRGVGSFLSYFEAQGFSRLFLRKAIELAIKNTRPMITILLDTPVVEAMRRKTQKNDPSKFDLMGSHFFRKQRDIFLRLSRSPTWKVIDGTLPIETTYGLVSEQVQNVLS